MSMSDLIRRRRRELGLTQQQVADAVGVSHGAVAQWEGRGKANTPGRDRLQPLAVALGLDVATLLGATQSRPTAMLITDEREQRLVEVWRRLSPLQQKTHLSLFYVSADVHEPEAIR